MLLLLTLRTTLPELEGSSGKKLTFLVLVVAMTGVSTPPPLQPAAKPSRTALELLRGLNFGGLNPAYLAGSNSPLSSFCEA